MSYNITNWRTVELDHLILPIEALEDDLAKNHKDCVIIREIGKDGLAKYYFCEDGVVGGRMLRNGMVSVHLVRCCGEHSGWAFEEVLVPLLSQSRGKLVADLVWEGGDRVERVTFINGERECRILTT